MVEIIDIKDNGIAKELGIEKGDKLVTINQKKINDYIDYLFETADDYIELEILHKNGRKSIYEIEKFPDDSIGIRLDGIVYDGLKKCNNKCIFCFVDQQPQDLRKSLLLKDDDYRFSFLQGSFITLTNLKENELKRIEKLNLSPLNISVHTTNPDLRVKMMSNPEAGRIMDLLKRFNKVGISFNTQIVLCPGINDGMELDRTLNDLITLKPGIKSIGIVPVGLTKYRQKLKKLNILKKDNAKSVITQVNNWQEKLKKKGKNYIYLADELYFKAGLKIPDYEEYHDFPQIENGIGLTRLLRHNFKSIKLPQNVKPKKHMALITGLLGEKALRPVIKSLNTIQNLKVELISVKNSFFGENITVTGLLTKKDIINKLNDLIKIPKNIILPGVIFNDNGYTLDGKTLNDFKNYLSDYNLYVCDSISEVLEVAQNE